MKLSTLLALSALWIAPDPRSAAEPLATHLSLEDEDEGAKESEAERKLRKAKALLEAQGTRAAQERAIDKMLANFAKMGLSADFAERFKDRYDLDELIEMSAKIWAERLDEETLDATLAFYATEGGKALAEAMPAIMEESLDVGMAYGERIGREVAEELGK